MAVVEIRLRLMVLPFHVEVLFDAGRTAEAVQVFLDPHSVAIDVDVRF